MHANSDSEGFCGAGFEWWDICHYGVDGTFYNVYDNTPFNGVVQTSKEPYPIYS